jgi:hypothetical protein
MGLKRHLSKFNKGWVPKEQNSPAIKNLFTHTNMDKKHNVRKALTISGITLLFAVTFMLLGMFIDIQLILKYNHSPISLTFTLLSIGALIGFLLAFKIVGQPHSD